MTSKLTFSALSYSKFLEIKMTNILSFYEDIAHSIAFNSDNICFEIITNEAETRNQQMTSQHHISPIQNVLNFVKPLQRSSDIVDYLIEREQLQTVKFTVNT